MNSTSTKRAEALATLAARQQRYVRELHQYENSREQLKKALHYVDVNEASEGYQLVKDAIKLADDTDMDELEMPGFKIWKHKEWLAAKGKVELSIKINDYLEQGGTLSKQSVLCPTVEAADKVQFGELLNWRSYGYLAGQFINELKRREGIEDED